MQLPFVYYDKETKRARRLGDGDKMIEWYNRLDHLLLPERSQQHNTPLCSPSCSSSLPYLLAHPCLSISPLLASCLPAFGQASAGCGTHRNQQAWMSHQHHSRISHPSPANTDSKNPPSPPKKARNYLPVVCSFLSTVSQHQPSPQAHCPSHVDNDLPHIRLDLGLSSNAGLSVLFDSCAALSSGYLPYCLWTIRESLDIFASFERFDDSNPFEPIKLGGAICHR